MAQTLEPIVNAHLSTRLRKRLLALHRRCVHAGEVHTRTCPRARAGDVVTSVIAAVVTALTDPNMRQCGRRGAAAGDAPA